MPLRGLRKWAPSKQGVRVGEYGGGAGSPPSLQESPSWAQAPGERACPGHCLPMHELSGVAVWWPGPFGVEVRKTNSRQLGQKGGVSSQYSTEAEEALRGPVPGAGAGGARWSSPSALSGLGSQGSRLRGGSRTVSSLLLHRFLKRHTLPEKSSPSQRVSGSPEAPRTAWRLS